ncbi:MAG: hypothetical protein ABJE66_08575 [Deltaproteobacteria bacterium]
MARLVAFYLLVAACQGSQSVPQTNGSGTTAGSTSSRIPPSPRRATPPPSLATTALAVGAAAPEIALTDAASAPWTLSEAEAKHARVMLVFYRGDW